MRWIGAVIGAGLGVYLAGCGPRPVEPASGGRSGSTHAVQVNHDTFQQEVLESEIPVVVDFWAPWCGPCRAIAPALETLATEFDGKVKVCKVNVDENQELASRYEIRSIPALKAFKAGEVVGQRIGSAGEGEFREWFTSLL